jgi:hypothetical protein
MADSLNAKPDSGFSVDLAALGGVARQVGQAVDGLQKAIAEYHSVQCTAADVGNPALAAQFASFDEGWASVLSVSSEAANELFAAVQGAGQSYATAEAHNAAVAGQAGS